MEAAAVRLLPQAARPAIQFLKFPISRLIEYLTKKMDQQRSLGVIGRKRRKPNKPILQFTAQNEIIKLSDELGGRD
jgi:hypothetical protein